MISDGNRWIAPLFDGIRRHQDALMNLQYNGPRNIDTGSVR